jgi:hypothetical protein
MKRFLSLFLVFVFSASISQAAAMDTVIVKPRQKVEGTGHFLVLKDTVVHGVCLRFQKEVSAVEFNKKTKGSQSQSYTLHTMNPAPDYKVVIISEKYSITNGDWKIFFGLPIRSTQEELLRDPGKVLLSMDVLKEKFTKRLRHADLL